MTEEARIRGIVVQVLQEALRSRDLGGVVLGAPPCPEGDLLARWCDGGPRLVALSRREVEPVERALDGAAEEAWIAAARIRGVRDGLLVVHPANKTRLLLGPVPPAPCYPLGDLWAGEVARWAGHASLPPVLASVDPAVAGDVEARLRRALEAGVGIPRALAGLDAGLSAVVERSLAHGRAAGRPPLIPKLGPWTLGLDPPP